MNMIKDAVLSVCFAAVCIGVIEMLLPHGSFKAPMKLLTGAVLLIALTSPFLNPPEIDFDNIISNSYVPKAELYDKSLQSLMQSTAIGIKQSIATVVLQNEISTAKIKIIMDKDEDYRIIIKGAEVYIYKKDMDRADKLCRDIKAQTGFDVTVKELDENG